VTDGGILRLAAGQDRRNSPVARSLLPISIGRNGMMTLGFYFFKLNNGNHPRENEILFEECLERGVPHHPTLSNCH